MGLVPEFFSKLVGGKKNQQPAAVEPNPTVNNGPSAVLPETAVNAPSLIMDPLVMSRPAMPEAAPSPTLEPPSGNMVTVETPTPASTINIASVATETAPSSIAVESTAPSVPSPVEAAPNEPVSSAATTTSDQQAA